MKKEKTESPEKRIKQLERHVRFLVKELSDRNRQYEIIENKMNEYKKIIDKFINDNKSFSSIAENIRQSWQAENETIEKASREYHSINDNINEVRRYLLEIYRILHKYDLFKIEAET